MELLFNHKRGRYPSDEADAGPGLWEASYSQSPLCHGAAMGSYPISRQCGMMDKSPVAKLNFLYVSPVSTTSYF